MQKWPFWLQSKPLFLAKFAIVGHFQPHWCEMIWKSWKTQKICWCTPPPEMETFEISPKMICFGGKRWEKLWIRWNWQFPVNLSLILGEKIEKYAKMAILTQSKPLFWPNLPLWVIFSRIGVKRFEKVGKKTQKICRCTPPEMKIFEISPKMICFGGKRWEKLWIGW